MMTRNAEAKKRSNDRKREQGMIPKHVWIHTDDDAKFNRYVERLNKDRGIK